MFLLKKDYFYLIREDKLNTVVQSDVTLRPKAEAAAEKEIRAYLKTGFQIDEIFKGISAWSPAIIYQYNSRVFLDAADWDDSLAYAVDSLITFTDNCVYIVTVLTAPGEDPVTNPAKFDKLGVKCDFFTALRTQIFQKRIVYAIDEFVSHNSVRYKVLIQTTGIELPDTAGTPFFEVDTTEVAAGTLPTDTDNWTPGDPRDELILQQMIDITLYSLHSRINPRNIPRIRTDRRDEAIQWLKMSVDPRNDMQPDLPERVFRDKTGTDITYGSNEKRENGQNSY